MRPRFARFTATAALAVGLSLSAGSAYSQAAGDFEKGVKAFDLGKYKDAIALWEPLAAEGNVDALRNMAQLYRLGLGVQQDDKKAFELYERAATRGNAAAQVNAAFLLLTGKGVDEPDPGEAASWFAKAADQGNALAQYNLGLMYEKGIGVKRNSELSVELYRLAADQGQRRAIARLDAMEDADTSTEATKTATAEDEKPTSQSPETTDGDEKSPELAAADSAEKPAAEKPDDEKAEDAAKAPDLAITPLNIKPLEFESLEAGKTAEDADGAKLPDYKSEAAQNGTSDDRPVINVVRTPTRKPGVIDPDAPKGDEPTPIYIQTVTVDKGADDEGASKTEGAGSDGDAPMPAYVQKYAADDGEAAGSGEDGAPMPASVISEDATDTKAPASISISEMRVPSDPVARVRIAEQAYRSGSYAEAAQLLEPLSDAGMPIAQFWMGRLYNRGEGVDLNRAEAYSLWRSASAGGSTQAATALANLASRLSPDEIAYAEQQHAASGRAR